MNGMTQIIYDPRELIAMILKERGIHDGMWTLSVEFQLGVGFAGTQPSQALPTAMASVSRIGIARANEQGGISFDAAELNPPPPQAPARRRGKAKVEKSE